MSTIPRSLRTIALVISLLLSSTVAEAELFRVALSTKDFGYLPLYVGMRSGLFAQEGLEVQWIVVNSNVVVTALIAGEIDVAGIAGSSMRAAARGAPLKANFFPYDKSLFVLMGSPGIKRVQDLKGKVIGTTDRARPPRSPPAWSCSIMAWIPKKMSRS